MILNRSCKHRLSVCVQDHCSVHHVLNLVFLLLVSQYWGFQESSQLVRDQFFGFNNEVEISLSWEYYSSRNLPIPLHIKISEEQFGGLSD